MPFNLFCNRHRRKVCSCPWAETLRIFDLPMIGSNRLPTGSLSIRRKENDYTTPLDGSFSRSPPIPARPHPAVPAISTPTCLAWWLLINCTRDEHSYPKIMPLSLRLLPSIWKPAKWPCRRALIHRQPVSFKTGSTLSWRTEMGVDHKQKMSKSRHKSNGGTRRLTPNVAVC